MKKRLLATFALAAGLLTACGVNNDTPEEAARTMMKGLTTGDSELIQQINHSDEWSFPTDHMIDIANEAGIVDTMDVDDYEYKVNEKNSNIIHAIPKSGESDKEWNLKFVKEKEGYFFIELSSY